MPANKNQIRRMQTIIRMLRSGSYPNYTKFVHEMRRQDIAGAFEVSGKTFSRDIAELRDEYGAPIRYDSCRKGFYLTNPEWYSEELMLEPFEMKAALLGERVASGIFPEPMRGEVSRAISALLTRNDDLGMAEGVELDTFQVLNPPGLPRIAPDVFLAAYNAWEQHRKLRLVYRSSKNRVSEKVFEPHVFAWNGGCWYLKGKLTRDDEKRYDDPKIQVLALHRIEKAEILKNDFPTDPAILKGVRESGLFDFGGYPEVDIEFFAPFAKPMEERYPGRVAARTARSVRIKTTVNNEYEAVQLVLGVCGYAKVYAPERLRTRLRRIAERIRQNLGEE